jgi:membrane protein
MAFNKDRMIEVGKRLKDKVSEADITGHAAEMAYRFFLAIFPFFIFLAALGGFVASAVDVRNPVDEIMNMIGDSLPDDSASVLRTQLEGVIESQNGGLLTIAIVGTIWASSSAFGALMKNFNQIFGVDEDRNLFMRYAIALGLTVLSAGFIVAAFVVFFFGQLYGPQLAGEIGLENTTADAISLLRWPAALILVMVAMAFLYWMAPNTKLPIQWISPGAVFFGIAWLIATFLFGLYVSNFGSYNATYGALGGVVILLIWFYLTAFLLLLGGAINAVLAEEVGGEDLTEHTETTSDDRTEAERGRAEREDGGRQPQPAFQESSTAAQGNGRAANGSRRTGPERPLQPAGYAAALTLEEAQRDRRPSRDGHGSYATAAMQHSEGADSRMSATDRVKQGLTGLVGLVALFRAVRGQTEDDYPEQGTGPEERNGGEPEMRPGSYSAR